jgi:hypothetical protein
MARTVTINHAQSIDVVPSTDPTTYVTTLTATYIVGYKDPTTGEFTPYSHPSFLGAAPVGKASIAAQPTDTHQTSYVALQQAIASAESLDIAGTDSVALN